jgi:hypothetical protein
MSHHVPRRPFRRAVLLLVLSACTGEQTEPGRSPVPGPAAAISAFSTVLPIQVRGFPNDPVLPPNPIYGWGNLQVKVNVSVGDACVPPNPITPQPGTTPIAVCGKIFNEGGARYISGGLYRLPSLGEEGPVQVAAFGGATPPQACRRYDLSGAVFVPDAVAADIATSPGGYAVQFDGFVDAGATTGATRIGGRLDGSAWGPVGERLATDPFFAAKVCEIAITP